MLLVVRCLFSLSLICTIVQIDINMMWVGRVVTAPTNGAAGVIPAVLKYFLEFISVAPPHQQSDEIMNFLLTSSAIGMLYKRGSSISAAEVGCQGGIQTCSRPIFHIFISGH
jgi:hypothetical protein